MLVDEHADLFGELHEGKRGGDCVHVCNCDLQAGLWGSPGQLRRVLVFVVDAVDAVVLMYLVAVYTIAAR